jgi:hypothetical protein
MPALQLGLLAQLVAGGIFGSIGTWLSSLFSGGFAGGGFVPPGQWGVAGEEGPEPIFGGKTGVTVQSGRGGAVIQNFNIGRMDQDTFHQTRRQFARTAKGALQ